MKIELSSDNDILVLTSQLDESARQIELLQKELIIMQEKANAATEKYINLYDTVVELSRLIILITTSKNLKECIQNITSSLQSWSGCEAIGIRLREGDDFPYFETFGFPQKFISSEKYLCAYDRKGKICRNDAGDPLLECMCGNIICGRFDPEKPYYTKSGSFWTNSTSELRNSESDEELKTRTRNKCVGDGYESVALIPLRYGNNILGLIQFNDKRKGHFSTAIIDNLEKMAHNLAMSLSLRKLEEDLHESELKYRHLVENSPDAIAIYQNRKIVFVNGECIRLLAARKNTDIIGKPVIQFVHIDYRELMVERLKIVPKTGMVFPLVEEKFIRLDGTELDVEVKTMAIQFEGNPAIQLIIRDITERKQTQDKLIESEEKYKRITEGLTDYVYSATIKTGKTIKIVKTIHSEACKSLTGYPAKEFLNSPDLWFNIIYSEDRLDFSNRLQNIQDNDISPSIDYRIICKNGKIRWVNDTIIPKFDSSGKITGYDGVIKDITEKKQTEQVLNARLRLLGYAYSQSSDGFQQILLDELEKITESEIGFFHTIDENQESLKLQSWSTNTIAKMCSADAKGQHYDINKAGVWVDCFFQKKPVIHNDYKSLPNRKGLPEGHALVERELTVPIIRNNIVVAILGVGNKKTDYTKRDAEVVELLSDMAWDIIDRKNIEELILQKNEELIKVNAEKDKFFSIIAHDLRSPFNAFLGFTQMMADELNNMSLTEVQKISNSLRNSATNLFQLLENLLEWSRFQRGVTMFNPETIFLKNITTEKIQTVLELANKKDIEIELNIPENLTAYADINMFGSIIRNLIYNAIKFSFRNGKIKLSAKQNEEGFIEFSVIDYGIGMTDEIINNLFCLNEKSKRSGTEGETSTGLGLIICKEFIEKHDGIILVNSSLDTGTSFMFTLHSGKTNK
jgi:PAS domain S-box-containing protein